MVPCLLRNEVLVCRRLAAVSKVALLRPSSSGPPGRAERAQARQGGRPPRRPSGALALRLPAGAGSGWLPSLL